MLHSPIDREPSVRDAAPRADAGGDARTSRRRRVAVVDDFADTRLFVELALGDAYAVTSYADGAAALAGLAQAPADLVLLDLDMPDMDGLEVLRRLRADPRLRATRVVVFTASGRARDPGWVAEAGFDGAVPKPVDDLGAFIADVGRWTETPRPTAGESPRG